MKNLVMGAAKGYGWQELEPFVTSCKKNCPDAELVLFVDNISDFTRDKLIRAGAILKSFPTELKNDIPNNTRWKIFADFLNAHGDNYAQIFITDTRDVIFQGNLFAPFKGYTNWLGFATECDNIGGELTGDQTNCKWLTNIFDAAEIYEILDRKIICDGTVIGSVAEMKTFCQMMWKMLSEISRRVDFRIHDQAVANYLVYKNRLPVKNFVDIDVHGGEIFTNAILKTNKTRGDKILRGDGGVPAVVHQYDRHENLVELVDKIYHDKNFFFDPRFTDTRSIVEQVSCLLCADKTAEAAQIFLRKFLSPADFGESINALINVLEVAERKIFAPPVEIIELAVQNILLSVEKLSVKQVFTVHRFLSRAKYNHHAVDPQFKENIAVRLFAFAEEYLEAYALEDCLLLLEMIEALDVPLNKNFYLLQAQANILLGRKDEALAAYKAAYELD